MSKPRIPQPIDEMAEYLWRLHAKRRQDIAERKKELGRRQVLTPNEREKVLEKTDKRCHLCGGEATNGKQLVADHVLPHASGGEHKIDNYLAAHDFCNRKRWMYSPEEFQMILKLGVWARHEMEKRTPIGKKMFKSAPAKIKKIPEIANA